MTMRRPGPRTSKNRSGFTLAETAIATLLVGMLLIVAARGVGVSIMLQSRTANQSAAGLLAEALMSEILQLPYQEPTGTASFGPESGETGSSRANYDDVDDYHGWLDSPPKYKDGSTMPVSGTWQRRVTVEWVTLNNVMQTSAAESGMKRITITVARNGTNVSARTALVAKAP